MVDLTSLYSRSSVSSWSRWLLLPVPYSFRASAITSPSSAVRPARESCSALSSGGRGGARSGGTQVASNGQCVHDWESNTARLRSNIVCSVARYRGAIDTYAATRRSSGFGASVTVDSRCAPPGVLQWTVRLSHTTESPALQRIRRGGEAVSTGSSGDTIKNCCDRGVPGASASARLVTPLCPRCEPGTTTKAPVVASWSKREVKLWRVHRPGRLRPFWSVWNQPSASGEPQLASSSTGGNMPIPSKLVSSSNESMPQRAANAPTSRGADRMYHMNALCPAPEPHTIPYWFVLMRCQVVGSARRIPLPEPSMNSHCSSRAICSSVALRTPASTT
mmetsp:Transcript_6563/g.17045  ORF Transcript_6563/g.17045 Transcript_6563/m.17045 type:complete len:334 (-) Transcript_6563:239-1240(-)